MVTRGPSSIQALSLLVLLSLLSFAFLSHDHRYYHVCTVQAFSASLTRPWQSPVENRGSEFRFHVSSKEATEVETKEKAENEDLEEDEADDNENENEQELNKVKFEAEAKVEKDPPTPERAVPKRETAMPMTSSYHGISSGKTVAATMASKRQMVSSFAAATPPPPPSFPSDPPISLSQKTYGMPSRTGAGTAVAAAVAVPEPTVRSSLRELIASTRPSNLPKVVVFHLVGAYMVAKSSGANFWPLVASPPMMITLAALALTSSTSMLVNDDRHYDFNSVFKPMAYSQKLPLQVTRRFLNYLYVAALAFVSVLPGIPAKLSVLTGLVLTFWYSQHRQPRTWLKSIVCASLVALAPLTSGISAFVLTDGTLGGLLPLLRVGGMLFVGMLGREITMDINDVREDKDHGVLTVPVVHGRKFASTFSFVCSLVATGIATGGPLLELLMAGNNSNVIARRLLLASTGGLVLLRRSFQVFQSNGEDPLIVKTAEEEGLLSFALLVASFI